MTTRSTAAIGLGANLANPVETFREALIRLQSRSEFRLRAVSSLYRTKPVGYDNQPDFTNGVAVCESMLGPFDLLSLLLATETELGRVRGEHRFGPRIIDLDLLLYDLQVIDTPTLMVPHPRMHERRFVLEPLAEIWPDAVIPGQGRLNDLLRTLPPDGVERGEKNWFETADDAIGGAFE